LSNKLTGLHAPPENNVYGHAYSFHNFTDRVNNLFPFWESIVWQVRQNYGPFQILFMDFCYSIIQLLLTPLWG